MDDSGEPRIAQLIAGLERYYPFGQDNGKGAAS
jgi:hypothetical protein